MAQVLSTQSHPRTSGLGVYLYPVLSRRAGGLSLGVNLNLDQVCSFHCRYCQVDRSQPKAPTKPDLAQLERELIHLFQNPQGFALAEIKDIALAGDGEPTILKSLPLALDLIQRLKEQYQLPAKTIVFTNGTGVGTKANLAALQKLHAQGGEVWFKLDFWDEASYHWINQGKAARKKIMGNLLTLGRQIPVVIQSCAAWDEDPKGCFQLEPYLAQLQSLLQQGLQVKKLQLYTLARVPAEAGMKPLELEDLQKMALQIGQQTGILVETYGQK